MDFKIAVNPGSGNPGVVVVVDCKNEPITFDESSGKVSVVNLMKEDDCLGKALKAQGGDLSTLIIELNSDGTLTVQDPSAGANKLMPCHALQDLVAKSLSTNSGPSAPKKKTPFLSLSSRVTTAASGAPELDIQAQTPTKTLATTWDIALYEKAISPNPILYTSTESEAETDALAKKILSCSKDSCSIIKPKCSDLPWTPSPCMDQRTLVHGNETLATVGVDGWQLDAILDVTSKIKMPTQQLYCTCPKPHEAPGVINFYSCDRQEFDFVASSLSTKCGPGAPNGTASHSVITV